MVSRPGIMIVHNHTRIIIHIRIMGHITIMATTITLIIATDMMSTNLSMTRMDNIRITFIRMSTVLFRARCEGPSPNEGQSSLPLVL